MKYVKKPVVVEAFQFGVDEMPGWFVEKRAHGEISVDGEYPDFEMEICEIKTLEGIMIGRIGDMIIKGVKGEIYPCKKDIFDETYEPYGEGQ